MTLKAVLFDLDGTLLDTAPDFVTSLNLLLAEEKQPPLDYQLIRNTVSNGAKALIELAFHLEETDSDFERLRQRLLALYTQHLADKTLPFDGINDVLAFVAAHKIAWGVVTNKPFVYTEPLLKQMPFVVAPKTVICPDHVTHRKPHPEPMLLACKQVGCKPYEAIYLGDHRRDIEAAQNASMQTIACAYGYIEQRDHVLDWHADYTVQHASDIIPILKQMLVIH